MNSGPQTLGLALALYPGAPCPPQGPQGLPLSHVVPQQRDKGRKPVSTGLREQEGMRRSCAQTHKRQRQRHRDTETPRDRERETDTEGDTERAGAWLRPGLSQPPLLAGGRGVSPGDGFSSEQLKGLLYAHLRRQECGGPPAASGDAQEEVG